MCGLCWVSVLSTDLSGLLPVPHSLYFSLKIRLYESSTWLLLKIVLAVLGPLFFLKNFGISLSISRKSYNGNLTGHQVSNK